jgi:lipopolysaccharide export system permease protein
MRPFLLVAGLAALGLYINAQWTAPAAHQLVRSITGEELQEGEQRRPSIGRVPLADGSLLLYAKYDGSLHDCYWLRTNDQVYHCERLEPHATPVSALRVDHLVRRTSGWEKAESLEKTLLPMVRIDPKQLEAALAGPDTLSLAQLMGRWRTDGATWLYARLLLPFLCLLAVLAPAPWCLYQRRRIAQLPPLAIALATLLAVWALIDAALIIGSQGLIAPEIALGTVALLLGGVLLLLCRRLWKHST